MLQVSICFFCFFDFGILYFVFVDGGYVVYMGGPLAATDPTPPLCFNGGMIAHSLTAQQHDSCAIISTSYYDLV